MNFAGAPLFKAITAQSYEFDFRVPAVTRKRPRQIGDEHKTALEQPQDREIIGNASGDFLRELRDPRLNLLLIEQFDGQSHALSPLRVR
jgi:hypothetical protein